MKVIHSVGITIVLIIFLTTVSLLSYAFGWIKIEYGRPCVTVATIYASGGQ